MTHIFQRNNGLLDHIFQRNNDLLNHIFLTNNGSFDHIFRRNNGSFLEFLELLDDLNVLELDILETVGKFNNAFILIE